MHLRFVFVFLFWCVFFSLLLYKDKTNKKLPEQINLNPFSVKIQATLTVGLMQALPLLLTLGISSPTLQYLVLGCMALTTLIGVLMIFITPMEKEEEAQVCVIYSTLPFKACMFYFSVNFIYRVKLYRCIGGSKKELYMQVLVLAVNFYFPIYYEKPHKEILRIVS